MEHGRHLFTNCEGYILVHTYKHHGTWETENQTHITHQKWIGKGEVRLAVSKTRIYDILQLTENVFIKKERESGIVFASRKVPDDFKTDCDAPVS